MHTLPTMWLWSGVRSVNIPSVFYYFFNAHLLHVKSDLGCPDHLQQGAYSNTWWITFIIQVSTVVFITLLLNNTHIKTHRNTHRERWGQWCVVVVCPFITQHKAPTIIHSLLCQTVEDLTFFTVICTWTCLDKDIKLFSLNETNKQTKRKKKNSLHTEIHSQYHTKIKQCQQTTVNWVKNRI